MLIVFPGQSVSPGLVTNISFCEILVEVGGGYAPVWIIKIVLDNCFYRAIAQLLNEYRISSLKLPVVSCFFGPGTGSTAGCAAARLVPPDILGPKFRVDEWNIDSCL